jgi:hypothetical protein
MSEVKIIKEIKINEATVSLRDDGIVDVLFNRNVILDVPLQMLLLNIYQEITERKKHPFLFEAFEGVKVTREAKLNALRIEDEAPGSAYAVVASNIGYYIIANFYLKVKRPKMPFRVFSKKEEAVDWLRGFSHLEKNAAG